MERIVGPVPAALANACPTLKVLTTKGKGHRDILSAPDVVRAIVRFVDPAAVSAL